MKAPRPRIHLLDVSEPLLAFHELQCRCGIVLHSAAPLFMLTEEFNLVIRPWQGCMICWENPPAAMAREAVRGQQLGCPICCENPPAPNETRTYLYGLIEAEESRHQPESESEEMLCTGIH